MRKFMFILFLPTAFHLFADVVRPWRGLIGMRPYSVFDNVANAQKIKALNLPPPVWFDDPAMYVWLDWPVPINDFINVDTIYHSIDWRKQPYRMIRTRVFTRDGTITVRPAHYRWEGVNR